MQLSVGPILKYPGPNTGIARTQYFIYRPRPWPRNKVLGLDFVEAKAKAKTLTTNNFRSYDIEENEVVQLCLFTDDIIIQVWFSDRASWTFKPIRRQHSSTRKLKKCADWFIWFNCVHLPLSPLLA